MSSSFSVRDMTVFLEGHTGMRRILSDVSLAVRTGKTFALVGESGSGKTCLVQSVLGLHEGEPGVVKGCAEVLGREVFAELPDYVVFEDGLSPVIRKDTAGWTKAMRRFWKDALGRDVTLIPQDASTALSPFHTVEEMLLVALRRGRPQLSREEAHVEALGWLRRVEMYDVENVTPRYVHELSGGMAQRVAIAIALAPEPGLVIADEPTTGLDATLRIQLITLLATMVKEKGLTLLLVTHDNAAARVLAEDVAVLYGGMIVESGPVEKVLNPEVPIKHPYTRFLLDAERRLNAGDEMPRISRGQIPPEGCPYAPQCDKVMDRCTLERPALSNVDAGEHRAACWGKENDGKHGRRGWVAKIVRRLRSAAAVGTQGSGS